jgi:ABC-type multidrug transport system fused ATPase/permease subunit
MINKIARMLLVAVVFGKIDPTKYTKAIIFDHMTVFQSVSKRLNSFIENAKKVVEASENSLNSKLDLLKIENTDHLMIKSSFDSQIEIVNLSKYYNENLVFKNLNFTIKRGDKIAITGVNGSGKSSFIKSLVGIENYEGDILIDGASTKTIRESSYSRLIAYVPQDPVVFSATLYDNITSFNSKHYPESVLSTVQEYDMDEIFKEIGYKTVLAEGGSNLSSAQRQKISFMRAVIRDSPIVLFDEVTSEMDKGYESFLVDSILTKMADKTVIMIVHNLDLLAKFDKVIFFNNNTACECLPLNELVSQNGNIEFKSYLDGFNSINK